MSEQRRCKECGKPLLFVKGESGKTIPLDTVAPVYQVTKDLTGLEVAKRPLENFYVSHFATCPSANKFSSGRKK